MPGVDGSAVPAPEKFPHGSGFWAVALAFLIVMENRPVGSRRPAKLPVPAAAATLAPFSNTIGTFRVGEAIAVTPEDLKVLMNVNLGTALWPSQAVEPYMRQRGKGSIVHAAARPATGPTAGIAAYSVSKAALGHLIRVLNLELRPHGIPVNAVAPQLIDTAANRATFPAELLTHVVRPKAIANVIAFLAGDLAAPGSGAIVPAYGA
jgi:NAD(P)-dependent dehydrogenase (short-subunit alcohol dehydrogenase family)